MRIVVALGGNALGDTPSEQQEKIKDAAGALCQLVEEGHELVLAHGNGPQVGKIQLAFDSARTINHNLPYMPLPECTAMSQGYIGFHLQKELQNQLKEKNIHKSVVTLITQVAVEREDPAFENPTKPIGGFYTEQDAEHMMEQNKGWIFKEDAGRGWRRVVASPKPVELLETRSIRTLVERGNIVIACGGGGVPVTWDGNGRIVSVPAVIDKDFAAEKLAEAVEADQLVILTAVDRVCLDWGTPNQREVAELSLESAQRYCREGQFAAGSMLPKVEAAIAFAEFGGEAIIASLEQAAQALKGHSGTRIKAGRGTALGGGETAAFTGGH